MADWGANNVPSRPTRFSPLSNIQNPYKTRQIVIYSFGNSYKHRPMRYPKHGSIANML